MNNAQLVIDEVKKAVKGKDDCIIGRGGRFGHSSGQPFL